MENIERRALLGDCLAQDECTRIGIVLPCPFCGGKAEVKSQKRDYGVSGTIVKCSWCLAHVYCLDEHAQVTETGIKNVPIENHRFLAIVRWNRRTAPPVGRCKDCANWDKEHHVGRESLGNYVCVCHEWSDEEDGHFRSTPPDGFCDNFDPKEETDNEE